MKSIKVKFHNKRKKLRKQVDSQQFNEQSKDKNVIDFLLRENTDTQQAKHQLRKVSQEVYGHLENQDNRYSWSNQKVGIPLYWLDEMENKKNIISKISKNNSSEQRQNMKNSLSYGQLKARNQIKLLKNQIMQRDICFKKSAFLTSINHKQKQDNDISNQNFKDQKKKQIQKNLTQYYEQQNEQNSQLSAPHKNLSTHQFKKRSRMLVYPSKAAFNQQKQKKQQPNKVSTVYFKVPQFNKSNIKRSVTVHSENNSSQMNINKSNFYLKKTKTICILQKPFDETNKCIYLSNYHSTLNTKKSKISRPSQLQKTKQKFKNKIQNQNQEILNKSSQNLKFNANRAHLEQTAKTMMLRQQFQRLRKLLKKELKSDFKVDQDLPIKILKL